MIGGYDILFGGHVQRGDVDVLLRCVRAFWPSAYVESGDGSLTSPAAEFLRREDLPSEFYIYEDRAAFEHWSAEGLTDDNAARMISVTIDGQGISFVVNAPGGVTAQLVADVTFNIRENRQRFAVPRAA
jgi:hypothetical protein